MWCNCSVSFFSYCSPFGLLVHPFHHLTCYHHQGILPSHSTPLSCILSYLMGRDSNFVSIQLPKLAAQYSLYLAQNSNRTGGRFAGIGCVPCALPGHMGLVVAAVAVHSAHQLDSLAGCRQEFVRPKLESANFLGFVLGRALGHTGTDPDAHFRWVPMESPG